MLKNFARVFFYNIAGITVSAAIFITIIDPGIEIPYYMLWQIIAMAAVCAFGNFIFYSRYEISKKKMLVRLICHYLYINLVVFGGAILFYWISIKSIWQNIIMLLLIALVYAAVTTVMFRQEENLARTVNKKLKKYHHKEDE